MVTARGFRNAALALENVSEAPHFDRFAFRTPRRIFATLAGDGSNANLRLDPMHQEVLVRARPEAFAAVKGAWGAQGWTTVTLANVDEPTLRDALTDAHTLVAVAVRARGKGATKGRRPTRSKPH
jgi:hypothetical protein